MDTQHIEQLKHIDKRLSRCTDDLSMHLTDTERHVEGVQRELHIMRENHLTHIQNATERQAEAAIKHEREISDMHKLVVRTSTNQEWLMRYHWIVASASVGALVSAVGAILLIVVKL